MQPEQIKIFLDHGNIPVVLRARIQWKIAVGQDEEVLSDHHTRTFNITAEELTDPIDFIASQVDNKLFDTLRLLIEHLVDNVEEDIAGLIAKSLAPLIDAARERQPKEKESVSFEKKLSSNTEPLTPAKLHQLLEEVYKPAIQKQLDQKSPLLDLLNKHIIIHSDIKKGHIYIVPSDKPYVTPETPAVELKNFWNTPGQIKPESNKAIFTPVHPSLTTGELFGLEYKPFVHTSGPEGSLASVGHTHGGIWFPRPICSKSCGFNSSEDSYADFDEAIQKFSKEIGGT